MAEDFNPYAPPRDELPLAEPVAGFLPEGRKVRVSRAWQWVGEGFRGFRLRWQSWLLISLVCFCGCAISVVPILGPLAMYVMVPIVIGGLMLGCADVEKGLPLRVSHLFAGLRRHFGRLVLLGLLYVLVLVGTMVALMSVGLRTDTTPGGSPVLDPHLWYLIAALTPVSVILQMAVWFAPALIVLNDLSIGAAMKASFLGCAKNIGTFFVHWLLTCVLYVVAVAPCLIGLAVFFPVVFVTMHVIYRDVFFAPATAPIEAEPA